MSKDQYNLKKKTNYLSRKMFLDPAGPVTVQRFEEVKQQKIQRYEEVARGFFWVPEEISLTKDKADHEKASDAIKHIYSSNLLRQSALDSLQGRSPAQVFMPVCSLPELEALMLIWSFFETNIHSKSYSHIIRNVYNVPKAEFDKVHDTNDIIQMAASIGRYYDALHVLNCKKELGVDVPLYEHKKAIWLALHTSYALEALRFMVSFATSFAMVENKMYIGNGNIIALIAQDEMLHTEWTAWLLNTIIKDDPDYKPIAEECKDEVYALYMEVIKEEKDWADFLFQKGVVIGLNAQILKDFVDYTAYTKLKDIGIKYLEKYPTSTPIPWYNKHIDLSKKQSALQETESVNYVIGSMSADINYDELPDL